MQLMATLGTAWTVTNDGTLRGGDNGVFLDRAGSSLTNSKSISGAGFSGVQLFNGGTVLIRWAGRSVVKLISGINITKNVGNVTNAGTITALSFLFGRDLISAAVGTVTNQAGGTISGSCRDRNPDRRRHCKQRNQRRHDHGYRRYIGGI